MARIIFSFLVCAFCTNVAFAALRDANSGARTVAQTVVPSESRSTFSRSASPTRRTVSRNTTTAHTRVARTARRTETVQNRGAITAAATRSAKVSAPRASTRRARAAISQPTSIQTNVFDSNYTECQQAYFACMDQFCALQNDKYRRCVCSAKLETVQSRERALAGAAGQLQDFKNLNIESILKTPAEVKAMLSASEGETKLSTVRDKSESMKKLTAIGDVLATKKSSATSTGGTLDIAGNINQIWTTTDLISGDMIANLTGTALYGAVHEQCSELIRPQCPSDTTLNMISSAYGMYIENDCATLIAALDKQANTANAALRETNREMSVARLENYDAHNATSINDCVAAVREKLTADTACGADYVHCLDITGLYLNRQTGEPIYTPNFFRLEEQLSISGDVLANPQNTNLIFELNRKKDYAKNTLETCRDISDAVWDEFLRTAITEIYQGQQSKIRQVKDECMDAVNQCYDESVARLRDYSNIENQMLLGARLVLAEEMCQDKLTTCSNLYGGGVAGLELLVTEMQKITEQKIAQNCLVTLQDYAQKLCRTPSNDIRGYPYGCRVYSPGGMLDEDNTTLYAKLKTYAGQYCTRPNEDDTEQASNIPLNILGNVSTVLDSIRNDMANVLATECEKLDGIWKPTFDSSELENKHTYFYNTTNANTEWGLCLKTEE